MLTLESSLDPFTVVCFEEGGSFAALSEDGGTTINRLNGVWTTPYERHVWNPREGVKRILHEADGVWHLDGVPLRSSDVDMSGAMKLPTRELTFGMIDQRRNQVIIMLRSQPAGQRAWSLQPYLGELPRPDARSVKLTKRHTPAAMSSDEGLQAIPVQLGGDDSCRIIFTGEGLAYSRLRAGRHAYDLLPIPDLHQLFWFFGDEREVTLRVTSLI